MSLTYVLKRGQLLYNYREIKSFSCLKTKPRKGIIGNSAPQCRFHTCGFVAFFRNQCMSTQPIYIFYKWLRLEFQHQANNKYPKPLIHIYPKHITCKWLYFPPVALWPVSWPRPPVFFLLSLPCLAATLNCYVLSNLIASFHT